MKKKFLSILLTVLMIVSVIPLTALPVFAHVFNFKGVEVVTNQANYVVPDPNYDYASYYAGINIDNSDLIVIYKLSDSLTLSEAVTADILVVGGGGSGSTGRKSTSGTVDNYKGSGGSGGEVCLKTDVILLPGEYEITVGKGGASVNASSTGGRTAGKNGNPSSVVGPEMFESIVAAGGAGGVTNELADGKSAADNTSDITGEEVTYGVGGKKSTSATKKGENATPNTGNGGGGGGRLNYTSGAGGSGIVIIRIKSLVTSKFIFVKSPAGIGYKLDFDPDLNQSELTETVSSVTEEISSKIGEDSQFLQLYYKDQLLSDGEKTLSYYGVNSGDVLNFKVLPHEALPTDGSTYKGTETATLFPDNTLEINIDNKTEESLNDGNVLYIGTADSYQQSNINELAKRCNVRSYIFSQSKSGYQSISEYDITDKLTRKGESAREISYPTESAGTDIVASKFVFALYRELIDNVNDMIYDKVVLSFNGNLADGANGEDTCLNIAEYATASGYSFTNKSAEQVLNELKEVLDRLYSKGKVVWLTPETYYGSDGYTSESTGNFAKYVLGGNGYKNPAQILRAESDVFKKYVFGAYKTLTVEDTLATGLTVKEIIPQIKDDGVWYDIPTEGYTESRFDTVITADTDKESVSAGTRVKAVFDMSEYQETACMNDICTQPELKVKIICEASGDFIQTYTGEEHPDFDSTTCTYELPVEDDLYDSFEFRVDSPEINCVHTHSFTTGYRDNGDGTHSGKCTDCDEYGATEAHTFVDGLCEKCGAIQKTAKNSAVIKNGFVYGISRIPSALSDYIELPTGYELQCNESSIGTGTVINIIKNNNVCEALTAVIYGDVNGDGICDVIDLAICEQTANKHTSLGGAYFAAADENGDEDINIGDYSAMVTRALA